MIVSDKDQRPAARYLFAAIMTRSSNKRPFSAARFDDDGYEYFTGEVSRDGWP